MVEAISMAVQALNAAANVQILVFVALGGIAVWLAALVIYQVVMRVLVPMLDIGGAGSSDTVQTVTMPRMRGGRRRG